MSDATTALAAAQVATSASQTASDAADFAAEKAVEVNADRVAAQAAAAAAGAQMWVGGEAVTTATVRQAPDGSRIKSNAARTTRATFDPTEQGFWTPVLSTAGTLEQVALSATIATQVPDATTTTKGRVELATTAEVATGTDADRVVTPAGAAATYAPLLASGKGLARTVNRADYATLALALTAAGSGGTVFYPDGSTYDEPATTLSAPITLDARRATIRKSANGVLFTITGIGVRLTKGLTIDGRGTVYTGATILVSGNGTSQDYVIDANVIDSDGPCIDHGIGAGQRGKFRSELAYTRERQVTDGATTAGSTTVTSANAAFTSNDVGKVIRILGAWDPSFPSYYLTTRIESVTNSTTVVVLDAPQVTVAAATVKIHAPVVRYGLEQAAGVNGDRSISGVYTAGAVLADFGGAQTINVTDTNSAGVIFSSSACVKVSLGGTNRLATSGAPTIVRGTQQTIGGGAMVAGDVVFETSSSNCAIDAGAVIAGKVYDKGNGNAVSRADAPMPPHTLDPRHLAGTSTLNANQVVYLRCRGRGYISKIGLHVGTSSGNICLAVYSNTGASGGRAARPGVRKATTGSVACPATGYQEVALTSPVYVEEGDWLAIVADNATASFYRCGTGGFGSGLNQGFCHHESSQFPAPATASPGNGTLFSVLLVGAA